MSQQQPPQFPNPHLPPHGYYMPPPPPPQQRSFIMKIVHFPITILRNIFGSNKSLGLRFGSCALAFILLCFSCTAFSMFGQATGIIPDSRATATAERATESAYQNATRTIIALTPTDTPTITPSPTITNTPSITPSLTRTPRPSATFTPTISPLPTNSPPPTALPTHTRTATPTYTPTISPTSTPDRLTANILQIEGVTTVTIATVRQLSPGTLAYVEIDVQPGYISPMTAERVYQAVFAEAVAQFGSANVAPFEFSVIMADGTQAVDYLWDNATDEWRTTPLTMYTPQATTAQLLPTLTRTPDICRQYDRPRSCATAVAYRLPASVIAACWPSLDRDGDNVACYGD